MKREKHGLITENKGSGFIEWKFPPANLPQNEQVVWICLRGAYASSAAECRIVKGFYTDGKHYNGDLPANRIFDNMDLKSRTRQTPKGWWEITGQCIILGEICQEVEKIDDKILAWMPLPEIPSIEEMREK